jgi:hypothetical protein
MIDTKPLPLRPYQVAELQSRLERIAHTPEHYSRAKIAADAALMMGHAKALQRMLEDLTIGGSEFVNNPERCVAYVVQRMESLDKIALNASVRAHEAEQALAAEQERKEKP